MTLRSAKWIFWAGTLASIAVFAAMTAETHRQLGALTHADRLDENVVAGKRVFESRNCNDCHTILGFGSYYAPDLTRAWTRIGEEGIRQRVQEPHVAFAGSYRLMPRQNVSDAEAAQLVAFLRWVDGIENHDWPPQDSPRRWKRSTEMLLAGSAMSPGAALVQQEGCLACHALGDAGESVGPRLEWIGGRRSAAWIADYVANPQAVAGNSVMPKSPHLSAAQRGAIAAFLVTAAHVEGR
ncbi:MAG TPA: c-type cytochrome [Vicinamibacteria bacterium]|nr:c-type cytochrome [Vicinamibacteria bacterium]